MHNSSYAYSQGKLELDFDKNNQSILKARIGISLTQDLQQVLLRRIALHLSQNNENHAIWKS